MNDLTLFDSFFNNALSDVMPDFAYRSSYNVPKVDVRENKDGYLFEMDLPGRTEKDVNIELDHNVLTISSRKEESKDEKKEDKKNEDSWLIRERRVNEFSRRFTLPDDINSEEISATFKNGVLTVKLPHKAVAAPKRISIEAA